MSWLPLICFTSAREFQISIHFARCPGIFALQAILGQVHCKPPKGTRTQKKIKGTHILLLALSIQISIWCYPTTRGFRVQAIFRHVL